MKKEPEFVQQIVDMYSAGENQKAIVETTGESYCVVRYWLKKKGLYDPDRRQTWRREVPFTQGIRKYNEQRKQEAESLIAIDLLQKGFNYLGGYDGNKSQIQISCFACGEVFTRYCDVHLKRKKTLDCPFCGEVAQQKLERKQEKEERYQRWKQQQELFEQKRVVKETEKKNKINELHVCKECNRLYTYEDYARSIGVDPICVQRVDCCSKECLKKQNRKKSRKYNVLHGKHKKRCEKWGLEYDPTVTLENMIEKWGLRCALCGEQCDCSDMEIRNGARIYGDNYPSIDHIVPLALKIKGHTWDNVQVAHRRCNYLKGAEFVG